MSERFKSKGYVLGLTAGLLCVLYIWFTLFPGRIPAEAFRYFNNSQVLQARQYINALRLANILNFMLQAGFLAWLVLGGGGSRLAVRVERLASGHYWPAVQLFFTGVWLVLQVINLPFAYFADFYWEHQWGLSTQSLASWAGDLLKNGFLEYVLYSMGLIILWKIINRRQRSWWLIVSALFSVWIVVQTYLWPVVVSPWFNRFTPNEDPQIAAIVRDMSQKAGIPVEEVLIMDAGMRTTTANAYFTGLGRTKRIVLYDTLLAQYSLAEIKTVIAHEMAHWQKGHIVRGLAAGTGGTFIMWAILYFLLPRKKRQGRYPPENIAAVLLFSLLLMFISSPLQNAVSRAMEREADLTAVELTRDPQAAVQLQVNLAVKNMSDISPPPFIRWFSYTHPPVLERIKAITEGPLAVSTMAGGTT
jgi:STE24 endopeptidase